MDFYDEISPLYHLIYPNWTRSVEPGRQLDDIIQQHWPGRYAIA